MHEPPAPNPETLLVLYLGSEEVVAQTCERVGAESVEPANPYWVRHGVSLTGPDGFLVVLVPALWPDSQEPQWLEAPNGRGARWVG